MHRRISRTDGLTRHYMIAKPGVVDWPHQMRMPHEDAIPFAILNGADDPFLDHAYIAGLDYGNIWTGGPRDIAEGQHARFFNSPEDFNQCLRAFIAWSRDHLAPPERQ